ncbi:hypothetical protein Csa_003466 [Cucumis sativus]|uniref:Uncharacterized protein n=1 Tax=Cucumis sativus TaxID=3659 RepID=A0A0A0KMX2_CUCSA|nr:hypothetical protein Csa_003466 [Cucumis sativus]
MNRHIKAYATRRGFFICHRLHQILLYISFTVTCATSVSVFNPRFHRRFWGFFDIPVFTGKEGNCLNYCRAYKNFES